MSYPSTALNLSNRNVLLKPKPLYTSSEEERNVSPPRLQFYPNHYGLPSGSFKFFDNPPIPYVHRVDSIPHLSGIESEPSRFSLSVLPHNFDSEWSQLSDLRTAAAGRSHFNPYHPYCYGPVATFPPGFNPYYCPGFHKPKRVRTAFSPNQLLMLERTFENNHYVVGNERRQLSQALGLSETQVKVWFQNRRTKHKRHKQDGESCSQKTDGKDCLDSTETSSDETSTSEDDEDERASCKTPSTLVSEKTLESDASDEKPSKTVNAIWNPLNERSD